MKLTKTQIESLANKIKRMMQEKIELNKDKAIEALKKTPDYKQFITLLNKREDLEERVNALNAIINKSAGLQYRRNKDLTIDAYIENKLPKSPKIEDIIDDITVATIDKDFDAETFINNYIKNYE